MTRSIWKGPFIDPYFIKFVRGTTFKLTESIKNETSSHRTLSMMRIWSRRSCILPQFVGSSVQVYNGKKWINLRITGEMVGHKFGEFASTRTIGTLKDKKTTFQMKTKLKVKTR
jgi:small subunit ribosomal protein S19